MILDGNKSVIVSLEETIPPYELITVALPEDAKSVAMLEPQV